jgi:predicted permease
MRADLDEIFDRDVGRGLSPSRARIRYAANMLASAGSMARWRLRVAGPGLGSLLDVKLGIRMLRKHPALTGVAVLALSIGIPVGLVPHHMKGLYEVTLPFDDGERIVELRAWDVEAGRTDRRVLHDFHAWRGSLQSFSRIGAARSGPLNVVDDEGRASPAAGAEVTASTFEILRVSPLLGRRLVEADEEPGAPDVVVIGYDLWRSRFGGDPDVLGRPLRIGRVSHEIVGVMPEGFLFPIRDHLWTPLRADPLAYPRGEGPSLFVFGRLADGVTLAGADAELRAVGARLAREHSTTNGDLRAEVVPFPKSEIDYGDPIFWQVQILALALLTIACGNVGTLILARTAARSGEIAVRTALGANRGRIVAQLFVEALVLAIVSAGVGLFLADQVAQRIQVFIEADVPFWFDVGMTRRTVVAALGLAVFAAVVAGVVPALKATGRHVQSNLQRARAGASGLRMGGFSTALIVAEVALVVGFLAVGGVLLPGLLQGREEGLGLPTGEYLSARFRVPTPDLAHAADRRLAVATAQEELVRRLRGEPGVRSVALATSLPGQSHAEIRVEVEAEARGADYGGHEVRASRVDVDYFGGLEQPILLGRDFDRGDLTGSSPEEHPVVIVNTSFVERVLQGRNPLGHRIRHMDRSGSGAPPSRWYEIVGVVGHLGMNDVNPEMDDGVYHPVARGEKNPIDVAVRVGADPGAFTGRLRSLAAEVDPTAMIEAPAPLDEARSEERIAMGWASFAVGLLAAVAVVLSSAGLYALVSFSVSERTREIGVRTALGARPGNIVTAIARRVFVQLGIGVALGIGLGFLMIRTMVGDEAFHEVNTPLLLAVVAAVTLVIGVLSCLPPVRRGLKIRPVEALKEG